MTEKHLLKKDNKDSSELDLEYVLKLWPLALPYAFLVAALNNLGYWQTFSINIFSFVDISQMLMGSLVHLLFLFILIFIYLIFIEFILASGFLIPSTSRSLKKIIATRTLIVMLSVVIFYFIYNKTYNEKSFFVSLWLAATPILIYKVRFDVHKTQRSLTNKFVLVFAFVYTPLPYFHGKYLSHAVYSGEYFLAVENKICADRYLGKEGNFYLFFNPFDKGLTIVETEKYGNLNLFTRYHEKCK